MDGFTRQRPGRKRKNVDLLANAQARENPSNISNGNGETDMSGNRTQEKPGATFDELVKIVADFDVTEDSIAMAFHPEPTAEMITAKRGWVRVVKGPAGYQTNNGKHVNL